MFDNNYTHMPLVGFFVYLRPRFRLLVALHMGWCMAAVWLTEKRGFPHFWFAHFATVLIAVLTLIFIWQLVTDKKQMFSAEVPRCIWGTGLITVVVVAIVAIAFLYIHPISFR